MKKFILIIVLACMSIGCATTGGNQVPPWGPREDEPFDVEMYFEWRGVEKWFCYRQKPSGAPAYPGKFRCNKVVRQSEFL
jgi:hypothetical protein